MFRMTTTVCLHSFLSRSFSPFQWSPQFAYTVFISLFVLTIRRTRPQWHIWKIASIVVIMKPSMLRNLLPSGHLSDLSYIQVIDRWKLKIKNVFMRKWVLQMTYFITYFMGFIYKMARTKSKIQYFFLKFISNNLILCTITWKVLRYRYEKSPSVYLFSSWYQQSFMIWVVKHTRG